MTRVGLLVCFLCLGFGTLSPAAPVTVQPCPVTIAPYAPDNPALSPRLVTRMMRGPALGPFVTITGQKATHPTTAWLLRTRDRLLIAVRCAIAPGTDLSCQHTARDSEVFLDESVEVFIDPGVSLRKYLHFLVNANNIQRDEAGDKLADPPYDVSWNGGWRSATWRGPGGWVALFAIPFGDLGLQPGKPGLVGLNVCRNDRAAGESTCWSPTVSGFHEPVRFGVASLPAGAVAPRVSVAVSPVAGPAARPGAPGPWEVGENVARVTVRNGARPAFRPNLLLIAGTEASRVVASRTLPRLASGQRAAADLPLQISKPGDNALIAAVRGPEGNAIALAKSVVTLPEEAPGEVGWRLAGPEGWGLWWAESLYKIHRDTPRPERPMSFLRFSAAAGEYQAAQLVVCPKADTTFTVDIGDLHGPGGRLPSDQVQVCEVAYVPVRTPTDRLGWPGDWPDPLPPLGPDRRLLCKAGQNQPFWLLLHVPPQAPPGAYTGKLHLGDGRQTAEVPVRLQVFGFALTPQTHTFTAYGVSPDFGFQGVTDRGQQKQVFDLYMQSCRDHRMAPYDPMSLYPMDIQLHAPMRKFSYGRFALEVDRSQASPWRLYWDGKLVASQATSMTHFEHQGIGWQGTGLGWPYVNGIESVTEVSRSAAMTVLDLVLIHPGSAECGRSFKLTYRLFIPHGDNWFGARLMKMESTDPVEIEVREYFNIPHTEFKAAVVSNGPNWAAWSGDGIGFGMVCLGAPVGGLQVSPGAQGVTVANSLPGFKIKQGQTHEGWGPLVVYFITTQLPPGGLQLRAQELARRLEGLDPAAYLPKSPARVTEEKREDFTFTHDFTQFDQGARRYLDDFHFTAFNMACMPDSIAGYARFTPEFNRLHKLMVGPVIEHLRQKGWLEKAYAYWFDEPSRADYPYVIQGMKLLRQNLPGLTRLLTIHPDDALDGYVDLWSPVLSDYNRDSAWPRQARGDRVWWYVCCGPRAPYPNNFIDHPALNHRIRAWMAEKYRVSGELFWATTYYGPLPDGKPRNPWTEAMTYTPDGKGTWGNGDGMLLYPPCRERSDKPVLKGPVSSIRWESLRDGLQDREYFWTLRQEVRRLERLKAIAKGSRLKLVEGALERAAVALAAPDRLCQSLTRYSKDPQSLLEERDRIAKAIEACERVR